MNEANGTAEPTTSQQGAEADVLSKVAGAMVIAAEAMKAGASDAQNAASRALPAASRVISKSAYATCYYLSYGIVFPSLLVAGLMPKNNPIYFGFLDGGRAARDSVQQMNARRAAMRQAAHEAQQQAMEIHASAAGASA